MPTKTKTLKKKCDQLWGEIIRELAGGRCQKCGTTPQPKGLHAHHVIGRSRTVLRHDLANGVALCYRCHIFWAHRHGDEFAAWFEEQWPHVWGYLQAKKWINVSGSQRHYEQKLEELKADW